MEVNQINNNNQQQNDLFKIVNDLRDKIKILEERQTMNEKLSNKNGNNILNLNRNIGLVYKYILDFKNEFKIKPQELNEKILKLEEENNKVIINNLNNEKIKNIKNEFEEMNKKIDNKFKELKMEIEKFKNDIDKKNKELEKLKSSVNMKNWALEQLQNKVNMKNKELEQLKKDISIKNTVLKIDEKEEKSVFEKFENLLGQVMLKNDINTDDLDKFEMICEKLIINDISPLNHLNKYFSDTVNLLFNKNELSDVHNKNLEKYSEIKQKIYLTVEKIENKLTEQYKNNHKNETQTKKPNNDIEKFRIKFGIQEADATDEEIIKYLNLCKDPTKAYQALMQRYCK